MAHSSWEDFQSINECPWVFPSFWCLFSNKIMQFSSIDLNSNQSIQFAWIELIQFSIELHYFVWEKTPTRLVHNFLNIDPFLMMFAPFESSRSPLSNGAKIIKNGSILRKLWANQVGHVIYKHHPSECDRSVTWNVPIKCPQKMSTENGHRKCSHKMFT